MLPTVDKQNRINNNDDLRLETKNLDDSLQLDLDIKKIQEQQRNAKGQRGASNFMTPDITIGGSRESVDRVATCNQVKEKMRIQVNNSRMSSGILSGADLDSAYDHPASRTQSIFNKTFQRKDQEENGNSNKPILITAASPQKSRNSPYRFSSSYKLPQFFVESPKLKEDRKKKFLQQVVDSKKIKNNMGLAADPESLVEGMADFLMEVGLSSSFIDQDELKARGMYQPLWQLLTRAMINPYSFENQLFASNLQPLLEDTKLYKEQQQNEKERQRRRERNKMLLNGDSPDNVSLVGNDKKSKRSTPKQSKRGQVSKLSTQGDNFSDIAKMQQIDMSNKLRSKTTLRRKPNPSQMVNDFNSNASPSPIKCRRPRQKSSEPTCLKEKASRLNAKKGDLIDIKKKIIQLQSKLAIFQKLKDATYKDKGSSMMSTNSDGNKTSNRTKFSSNEPGGLSSPSPQEIQTNNLIKQLQIVKGYKEQDIELDEHLIRDEFRKIAISIISSQKIFSKVGKDIFRQPEDKRLPGISPVTQMILGNNDPLLFGKYEKNYSYRKDFRDSQMTNFNYSVSRMNDILEQPEAKVTTPGNSWRQKVVANRIPAQELLKNVKSANPAFKKIKKSQEHLNLIENITSLTFDGKYEATSHLPSNLNSTVQTQFTNQITREQSPREFCTPCDSTIQDDFSLAENVERLKKIRKERYNIYDSEKTQNYKIKSNYRASYKRFNMMDLTHMNPQYSKNGFKRVETTRSNKGSPSTSTKEMVLTRLNKINNSTGDVSEIGQDDLNQNSTLSTKLFNDQNQSNPFQDLSKELDVNTSTNLSASRSRNVINYKFNTQMSPRNPQQTQLSTPKNHLWPVENDPLLSELKQSYYSKMKKPREREQINSSIQRVYNQSIAYSSVRDNKISPRSPRIHNNTQQKSMLFPQIDHILGKSMMNLKMINNHYRSNSTLSSMKKQMKKSNQKKKIHQKSLIHFEQQNPEIQVIDQNLSQKMALSCLEIIPFKVSPRSPNNEKAYRDQPKMPVIRGRKGSSLIEPFKTKNDRSDFEPVFNNTEESPPRSNRIKFELQ